MIYRGAAWVAVELCVLEVEHSRMTLDVESMAKCSGCQTADWHKGGFHRLQDVARRDCVVSPTPWPI